MAQKGKIEAIQNRGDVYKGSDGEKDVIAKPYGVLKVGSDISAKKAAQLLSDFPDNWSTEIIDPPKSEEAIAADAEKAVVEPSEKAVETPDKEA